MRVAVLLATFLGTCCVYAQTDRAASEAQRAQDLLRSGEPDKAIPIYRELSRQFPANAGLRVNLCIAEFQARRYREAIADAQEALKAQPGLPPAELFLGASRLELGDFAGAVESLERAARAQPSDRNAALFLARALLGAGRLVESAEEFRRAAALAPDNPKIWYGLGRTYEGLSDTVHAQEAWERLAHLPPSPEIYIHQAEVKERTGEYVEAARLWREALRMAPDDPRGETGLIWALYRGRDYAAALALLDGLLAENSESAELNFLRGASLVNLEQPEKGLPFLEKAVTLNARFLPAQAALGQALLRIGKAEQAIPHLKAALPSDPDGSGHFQFYRACQIAGHREEAKRALTEYRSFISREVK